MGGWLSYLDDQGRADPSQSAWFSLEVSPEDFPWVFIRGRKPSQIISTLEALAVLLSLKLFVAQQPEGHRSRVNILPTWTDNRGNGSVLNKLMATRYPSSALVRELAAEMKKNRVKAQVEWTPREFNREADALANGDTSQLSPELELRVGPHTLKWHVLSRNGTHCREGARIAQTECWASRQSSEAKAAQARRTCDVQGHVVRFSRTSCFVDAIGKRCTRSD